MTGTESTRRLMGAETELALSAKCRSGGQGLDALGSGLIGIARARLTHLPGASLSSLFLSNGGRLYIDYGNHPEICTPEVANPWDLVRHLRAGERILAGILREMRDRREFEEVRLFRCNVDYGGTGATWGCHESYLHRGIGPASMSTHLIPFLVSRIIWSGAGGFDSHIPGGWFVLSPRVPHLARAVSDRSTADRGIFHTKDESLCGAGWHRLHVLSGESLCSDLAAWLRAGATALVVALCEGGTCPGSGVQMEQPLMAMQAFARDETCSTPIKGAGGRTLTALGIQRHYLSQAVAHLHEPFMPGWAEQVCLVWREILDLLEDGAPDSVATSLDWAIKRAVFAQFLTTKGRSWEWLRACAEVIAEVGRCTLPLGLEEMLELGFIPHDCSDRVAPMMMQRGLERQDLADAVALRRQLCELDMRFGSLGDDSLFASLERDGVLEHHVPGVDRIDEAMTQPPPGGRAHIRGEAIARLASQGGRHRCDWLGIHDTVGHRILDLSDPFETEERWEEVRARGPSVPQELDHVLAEMALRRGARHFDELLTAGP